jgi:hypothetical protein
VRPRGARGRAADGAPGAGWTAPSTGGVYDRRVPYRVAPPSPPTFPEGPDHVAAARRRARRNRRIGLSLAAALAVGLGASMVVHRSYRARHRAAFDGARLDLEACMLGPEPLPASAHGAGSCGLRIRRRQLVAMTTPVERRIDDGLEGWPMRCSEATRRMSREAIELEELALQREAAEATKRLATMKALSAPLDLPICTDAEGRPRAPRPSTAQHPTLPALAAPLDLDALRAHGPPALPARNGGDLELDERLAGLMPDGYREVGVIGTSPTDGPPRLPEGESVMTDRDWPGIIHLAKCRGGTCERHIVSRETFDLNDPELRASEPDRFRPARIGASIVAVWRAGTRGGLRMRLAPVSGLAAARDVVIFDDLVRDGAVRGTSTLESFRLYGGTREARLLLVTGEGTWVIVLDAEGRLSLR